MDNPIRLDDLPLDALNELKSAIEALSKFGTNAQQMGFDPRFDLRPGFPVRMTLGYRMPMAAPMESGLAAFKAGPRPSPRHPVPPAPGPDFLAACDAGLAKIELDDDGQAWIVVPEPEVKTEAEDLTLQGAKLNLEPAPLTAADIETAVSGAFIAVTGRDPKPVPQPAPQSDDEDAAAPAAFEPIGQSHVHAKNDDGDKNGAPWTGAEDRRLVQIVSERMARLGHSKSAASDFAAVQLGRPLLGTYYRLRKQLAEPLAAALAMRQAGKSEPAAPLTPKASPADSGGGADPSPAAPIAPASPAPSTQANTLTAATLSPIEQHLLNMPTKGGWTLELDRDLLQMAEDGWKMADIALDMGRDAHAVQERFNLLTGWDRDAKTRKYTRAALLDAAKDWCAKSRAAAE